jgi:hypothetical protein
MHVGPVHQRPRCGRSIQSLDASESLQYSERDVTRTFLAILAIASLTVGAVAFASDAAPKSLLGVWTATYDEDGTPADVFELRGDGTYVNFGIDCNVAEEMPYHMFRGDIYVTSEIPGKGPISIVFRPSADGSKLTFTSPRSRNNATYEKLATNPCKPKE